MIIREIEGERVFVKTLQQSYCNNSRSFDQFCLTVHKQKKLIYIVQEYEQNVKERKENTFIISLVTFCFVSQWFIGRAKNFANYSKPRQDELVEKIRRKI